MKFIASKHGPTGKAGSRHGRDGNRPVGTPRFLKTAATPPRQVARFNIAEPGSRHEREADQAARRLAAAGAPAEPTTARPAAMPRQPSGPSVAQAAASTGQPLDGATRQRMETRFDNDLSHVRVHTGSHAAGLNRNLGSRAFTQGRDIFYGAGETPGDNELTAHELAHVVQQSGGNDDTLSARWGDAPIQCSFTGSYMIPGRTDGGFEIDLQTREGALATPATASGMDGYIRFVPAPGAPNSNIITLNQIVKLTDQGGTDVAPGSLPAAQAPRGALGQPGLLTADNPLAGIEGGYFTDVQGANVARHQPLSTAFRWEPAGPGVTGTVGQVPQPAQYGGGVGGVLGRTPGFKRSDDPADIRSAALYDTPGTSSPTANLDFKFETAALGEDTGVTYGSVHWGFGLRLGRVVGEYLNVNAGTSATFTEALERHRDFYVHEPVTFYFGFNKDVLTATEAAKIDAFLPYLKRNPDVRLSLEGFADIVGGASQYNLDLSMRRVEAVEAALLGKGIPAARIDSISFGFGASTSATTNAGTGDQGGNAAVGANQSREANRWANRRVVLTFSHPAPAAPAPGP